MSFGYTKSLRRHMEHIHKETIESHDEKTAKDGTIPEISNRCLPCDKDFGIPSRLKEHNVAVHKGEKPFRCKICESTFGYKRNLYTHMATIHKEGFDSQDEDSDTDKFPPLYSDSGDPVTHLDDDDDGLEFTLTNRF